MVRTTPRKPKSAGTKYLKSGCSTIRFHDNSKIIIEACSPKRKSHRPRNVEEWLLAGRARSATASLEMGKSGASKYNNPKLCSYRPTCAQWMSLSPTDLVLRIVLTYDADVSYGPNVALIQANHLYAVSRGFCHRQGLNWAGELSEDCQSTTERTNTGKGIEKGLQSLIICREYSQEQECRQMSN